MLEKTLNTPYTFLLYFLLLLPVGVIAQEEQPTDSLSVAQYLREVETEFGIKFSYVDEALSGLSIQRPPTNDINTQLRSIAMQTGLEFTRINDRYYAISLPGKIDVCAYVFDNFEVNSISGASVEVLGSDLSTITDTEGRFQLQAVPRDATLRIRHLGYKPKFIRATSIIGENCPVLPLAVLYEQLEEVVVFDILTSGIKSQGDGSITLDIEDFGILPGQSEPDVLQSVQALPGVKSIDETVSDINIRGGTNDQNVLLWDGMKMYQSGHFFGLISAFNPYLTDKVTLYKNGTPARLGEGVSGTIAMETADDIGSQAYGGAGFNLISGDVYIHMPLNDKTAVQFSARRSVTDFINTPTYKQFFNRAFQDTEVQGQQGSENVDQEEEFYFYDLSAKFLYNPSEDHKVRVSALHINNDLRYSETREGESSADESTLDQTNLSVGLRWDGTWSDTFRTHTNAFFTRYNLDARTLTNDGEQRLFQNNLVEEGSIRLSSYWKLSSTLEWENGYQFSEVGITNTAQVTQPPFDSNIKDVLRTHAPYSELSYSSPGRKFMLSTGLRMSRLENPGDFSLWRAEPRLRVNTLLVPNLRFTILGEYKTQGIGQVVDLEQNFLGIEKRRWFVSDNDELPVTRSKQASAGLIFDKGAWYMSGEIFAKDVDGISTLTQGFQNEGQFENEQGGYFIKGAELLLNYRENRISTWLSYTYNENTYDFPDLDPSRFPNNLDIRHTATLAMTYEVSDLKLGFGFNYRTGKPYTKPQQDGNGLNIDLFPQSINYESPNSSRLPDYLRTDFSVIYSFQLTPGIKAKAGASILNILNRRNVLNAYYRVNEEDEIERVESLSLGLTPNVSFRISF